LCATSLTASCAYTIQSCRSPEKTFQPNYSVKAVKPQREQSDLQENNDKNDWQPTNQWHEPQTQEPQQWTWTDENGKVWRNEAHDCKFGVYTYVDKDEINVKVRHPVLLYKFDELQPTKMLYRFTGLHQGEGGCPWCCNR
jgi:hypothetical protein